EVTRTILGRHSRAAAETYAIYSRDLIVAPTRELQGVINKVPQTETWFVNEKSHILHVLSNAASGDDFLHRDIPHAAMASILDSEAQFDLRSNECKVIDQQEFTAWVRTLEPHATLGGIASLRRLTFESQTQLLALLKEQVTAPEAMPRKVPQAEREARLALVQGRLNGVSIEGVMEPGHALLDAVVHMVEKNQFKYLSPDRCISRVHELTNQKTPDRILEIEANKIVVKNQDEGLEVAAHSSLQILEALKRRGIALEFGDCMDYNKREKYLQTLFQHLHREPPPGFQRCTVSQLVAADKEAWKRVIELNVKPRRAEDGSRPLDTQLLQALTSYEVSFTLIPLPSKPKPEPKRDKGDYQLQDGSKGKGKPLTGPKPLRSEEFPDGLPNLNTLDRIRETAYPLQLAYTIAHAFASIAVDRGWSPPGQPLTPPSKVHYAFLRAVVGQQPKASRLPPVLSEYAEVIHRHFNPQTLPIQPGQLLPSDWQDIPAGSKFLKYTPLRLTGGDGNRNVGEVEAGKVSGAFGVYRSPDVFVKEAEEDQIRQSLPDHAKAILAPKRIALWTHLLREYNYPDQGVVDELIGGVRLTGPVPRSAVFEHSFKPALLTEGELQKGAPASRAALIHSVRSSGDAFIDAEVYRKTQEEVRLIDDFSCSMVNQTTQVETTPQLHTLDVIAALLLELAKEWVGKTVDLAAAYRQLAISPQSLWASYVATFNPTSRRVEIYQVLAWPFGASSSVYGFIRVAHSLWWLGCVGLDFVWTSFYDDFVTLARNGEQDLVDRAVKQGDKDQPFGQTFCALGVEISFKSWSKGIAVWQNTKRRIRELVETIDKILEAGELAQPLALSLRGRMQFARRQIWGRSSKICLNAITNHAYGGPSKKLSPE
ncbi:unnamed protein product, partial [Durusdinium trenchii]